jgi:CAAX protease family protein
MQTGKAGGFQIAFMIYAAWLLVVPFSRFIAGALGLDAFPRDVFDRYVAVGVAGAGLLLIAPLRRLCAAELARPVPSDLKGEVAAVSLLNPLHFFAYAGAAVLWWHYQGDASLVERRIADMGPHAHAMAAALRPLELASHLAIAVVAGPIIEELIFRAFLFRAWERRFGFIISMLLSSAVFASLHPNFLPSFLASIAFVCVYRRTGSIRASIIVHAASNVAALYPMLGRWVFPRDLAVPGNLSSWSLQIGCLLAVLLVWPIYIWMSRDRADTPIVLEDHHVALPR